MSEIPNVTALIFMKHVSERVPRKNMRDFCGKPLFFWIIEALQKSKYISKIIINTDSDEIAESAKNNFDVIIHKRPDYLLTITSNEANQIMEYDLSVDDSAFYLQTHSTNPILKTETIDAAIKSFFQGANHDSLMSVTAMKKRFYWPDGSAVNHDPEKLIKTQELPPILEENSCIYMFTRDNFEKQKNRIGKKPLLFPIDALEAWDIDEESDFTIAESIMKYTLSKK
jgi:N-acylneuraminate cytidylyltransferase